MDQDRARELLAAERRRIERELAALQRDEATPEDEDLDAGDQATDLYQDELDESRISASNWLRSSGQKTELRAAPTGCPSRVDYRSPTSVWRRTQQLS